MLDRLLNASGLLVSVVGMFPSSDFWAHKHRIRLLLGVLAVVWGITLGRVWLHTRQVYQVAGEIEAKLPASPGWTFERISQQLFDRDFALVREAILRGVLDQRFLHRVVELRTPDGSLQPVRIYWTEGPGSEEGR